MVERDPPLMDRMAAQLRDAGDAVDALMQRTGDYLAQGEDAATGIREVLGAYEALKVPAAEQAPFEVHVILGELEAGKRSETMTFGTAAEREAFMAGVKATAGNNDYAFCEHPDMAVMVDGKVRRLPVGVEAEATVLKYQVNAADHCYLCVAYALDADDKLVELEGTEWVPREAEAETVSVDIEIFCDPAVGRCDPVELTGDQHRDLESSGRLDDYLQLLATLRTESAEELLREVSPGALRP